MKEIWKDIIGYEGLYQISNYGNIRSYGNFGNKGNGIILKQSTNGNYKKVVLYKDSIGRTFNSHRLVAINFKSNPYNKLQVNHIDGNKHNNYIDNLEWCTKSENELHKYRILGHKNNFQNNHIYKGKFGKNNRKSKSIKQYDLNGKLINTFGGIREAERILNLNNISRVCNGKQSQSGGYIFKFTSDDVLDRLLKI